ncbi:hypothetical protein [Caballeronia ptereochthonis]|uniref:Uncharacterized protein n=1 Tax=Caballeronia ptereochthonis TaxID=1777144 RepID=A0A158B1Z9_9BURK|nr:hypothetical protein [Caballeronia ptereochthonis]SAK64019.1 hypothetical protein AWB83_02648 [Caballeronia ptereochthonis]
MFELIADYTHARHRMLEEYLPTGTCKFRLRSNEVRYPGSVVPDIAQTVGRSVMFKPRTVL